MIKRILTALIITFCTFSLMGQNNVPIWDIGTKWTYEFSQDGNTTSFLINEIVDTTIINNMKLYVVSSSPVYSGIQYFYYENGLVYNYNANDDFLELLYNFNTQTNYNTNYRPICDEEFPYDSLLFKEYTVLVDTITSFEMPDGSSRNLQHASIQDTIFEGGEVFIITDLNRSILKDIGFMQGGIHLTHNWEAGMYICDEDANFVSNLRCFQNDSISYNFVGYPCDSTWVLSSVDPIFSMPTIEVYPNPTSNKIYIKGFGGEFRYEVYTSYGSLLEKGITVNQTIDIKKYGLNIIRMNINGAWITERVIRIKN
jgi:hypothetical protein